MNLKTVWSHCVLYLAVLIYSTMATKISRWFLTKISTRYDYVCTKGGLISKGIIIIFNLGSISKKCVVRNQCPSNLSLYVENLRKSNYENLGPNWNNFRNLTAFNCRMRASFSISFYAFDDSCWVMNGNGLKKIKCVWVCVFYLSWF